MTLFIACLLIYQFGLDWRWYVAAVVVWIAEVAVWYSETEANRKRQVIVGEVLERLIGESEGRLRDEILEMRGRR